MEEDAIVERPPEHLRPPWLEAGWALLGPDRQILDLNDDMAQWLNAPRADLTGRPFQEALLAVYPQWEQPLQALWGAPGPFEACTLHDPRAGWFRLETLRHPGGWGARVSSLLPPMAELADGPWNASLGGERQQRQMLVRLVKAETQLGNLMHRWPGVIFSQRADFSYQFVSPRIRELTGVPAEQWLQQAHKFWTVVHEADAEELYQQCRRAAHQREGVETTFRVRNTQTSRIAHVLEHRQALVSANGMVFGYEGFWLDVTRQTMAERRLSSAAWKETLATLTMGLAHDFSNVLAGILSLSESFLAQLTQEHPFKEGLGLIKQNAWLASQLVQRIMNLHRCKTGEQNYHDLNAIISELVDLVQRILPRRITVSSEPSSMQLPLYVDAVEFRQVILNLALNAADAMPQRGTLVFRSSLHTEAEELKNCHGTFPRLPCVCLTVADSGTGIAPKHLPFLFDPFFTTKPVNKGSGLGLYNARLFVEKHGGAISVESTEGAGTRFHVWLPQADFTETERARSAERFQRIHLLLAGETGMLMDSTAEFLRVNGYYVRQAFSVERAADILLEGDSIPFRGMMVLAGPAERSFIDFACSARRQHASLRVILQLVGEDPDELSSDLHRQLDLVVTAHMSEDDMLRGMNKLFETPSHDSAY